MYDFLQLLHLVLRTFEVWQSPQAFLVLVGLSFARFLAFLLIVPFFGGQAVPSRVKVAAAMALVIIVYPALAATLPPNGGALPFGAVGFIALLAKESFVGFTLGYIASSVFQAVQSAGRFIDAQRGASMAELFAPQLQEKVSELGQFQVQFAIVVFLTIGAHRFFLSSLIESYQYIPALGFPKVQPGWTPAVELIVTLTGSMLAVGVQLAMPAVVALLLTDLFFGLINRVAPQANVFFLSMPVKMAVGIFVVLLTLQFLQSQYINYFGKSYESFEYMLKYLSGSF